MGTLSLVKEPPKGLHWKVQVDGRNVESEEELLERVRSGSRGKAFYFKTNFRDTSIRGMARISSSRKKHFTDGYWVYTFWFVRKSDAAIFKLFYE